MHNTHTALILKTLLSYTYTCFGCETHMHSAHMLSASVGTFSAKQAGEAKLWILCQWTVSKVEELKSQNSALTSMLSSFYITE